MNKMSKSYFR